MNPWQDTAAGSTDRQLAENHIFLPGENVQVNKTNTENEDDGNSCASVRA